VGLLHARKLFTILLKFWLVTFEVTKIRTLANYVGFHFSKNRKKKFVFFRRQLTFSLKKKTL